MPIILFYQTILIKNWNYEYMLWVIVKNCFSWVLMYKKYLFAGATVTTAGISVYAIHKYHHSDLEYLGNGVIYRGKQFKIKYGDKMYIMES